MQNSYLIVSPDPPNFYAYRNLCSCIRNASNPMDKGACNFVNSKIQTWLPSTIKSNFIEFLIVEMHARVRHATGTTEMKLGNKAKQYGERIVAEAKQDSLLLYTNDVKITTTNLFYNSVALPS